MVPNSSEREVSFKIIFIIHFLIKYSPINNSLIQQGAFILKKSNSSGFDYYNPNDSPEQSLNIIALTIH